MDNWTTEQILRLGRKASFVFWASLLIPFVFGFILAISAILKQALFADFHVVLVKWLDRIALLSFIMSAILTIMTASEASGRTATSRTSSSQLDRPLTRKQKRKIVKSYERQPQLFPWHYIMRVPSFVLEFHLHWGCVGVPSQFLQTKSPAK